MKKTLLAILLLQTLLVIKLMALDIEEKTAHKIALKIWHNECRGTKEGLTHWNDGEDFASLGIGHFIWYPPKKIGIFEETFPKLLNFLEKKKIELPIWLKEAKKSPWHTRKEFYQDINSEKMISLREILDQTKHLQALFMAERLEKTFPLLIAQLSQDEKEKMSLLFYHLAHDSRGLYALVDYLNFKGTGLSTKETYQGQGWGLLQVLLATSPSSEDVVADFVRSAKYLLEQRVKNSPPERNEKKWLSGWLNRVDSYLSP